MTWVVAPAIVTVRAEVNAAYPDRPKGADGTIGDARHQAEQSDHNPNPPHPGVVTAWDCTTAPFTIELAEKFRVMGGLGDARIKYVIYRGRITSAEHGWHWVSYSGFSQHFDHIHLSVSDDPSQYNRTDPWDLFHFAAHTTTPPTVLEDDMPVLIRRKGGKGVHVTDWIHRRIIATNAELNTITGSGVPAHIYEVTQDVFDRLKEAK